MWMDCSNMSLLEEDMRREQRKRYSGNFTPVVGGFSLTSNFGINIEFSVAVERPSSDLNTEQGEVDDPLTESEINQIIQNRKDLREGRSKLYNNVEEYLKSLDEDT